MKKIKKIISTVLTFAIISSLCSINVFAEENIVSNRLAALQPYVDELQAINEELGTDMQICLSGPEEIASSYEEFSKMAVNEFRDYIVKVYNDNYLNYSESAVPDEPAVVSDDAMRAGGLYDLEQKIWQLGGNFFTIKSQYSYGDGKARYYSIHTWNQAIFSYPAYRANLIKSTIIGDKTSANIEIFYKHYLTENLLYASNELRKNVTIYAGGGDVYLPEHFQNI